MTPKANEKRSDLLGAWEIFEAYSNGATNKACVGVTEVYEKACFWWTNGSITSDLFSYTIDEHLDPMQIDVISESGVCRGIYVIANGILTMCFADEDNDARPTEFVSSESNKWSLSKATRLLCSPSRVH